MKIIKPQTLSLLTRPFEFRREFWLGVAVVAFMPVGETPALLPEAAMWPTLAEELPPDQPLDAVMPKARPEFLAVAHCFAPDGLAAPLVRTGIQLGPLIKLLDVHGDRDFDEQARRISPPVPFTHMPMDWTRTYGGAGFADNPLGKGAGVGEGSRGRIVPVQNIINPKLGRDGARVPAAFAPLDQMWPARAALAGTYDDRWLKQDFPGLASDINWEFFNAAPRDQWLPQPLAGDETYAFKNLHPEQKLQKGRLPGMVPRLFLVRKNIAGGGFEEVPLSLTTVWFFPHRERLALVHHGRARILEEDANDIARVVVGADRLGAPRPAEQFHAVMVKRADSKDGVMHTLRDADLVPEEWLPPPTPMPNVAASAFTLATARARARAERDNAAAREEVQAKGLDPDKYGPPPLPPPHPPPTLEELPAFAEAEIAKAEAAKTAALAAIEAKKTEMATRLRAADVPEEEIERRINPKAKGPPTLSAAAMRADMAAQIAAMRTLGQLTFGLEAQLASPEMAAQLNAAEAAARDGYRLMAHLQDPADPQPSEHNLELRRLIASDTAAARALYDLHGADLSGLDLSGLDLSGICLDNANLAGTSFVGSNLAGAVLAHAGMQGCRLDGADLSGANLGHAQLAGASLRQARLMKSVLAGADLTNASLAGADLEGADISGIITTGTDFSGVHAAEILAVKLSLPGLRAPGIVLTKAKFIECNLQGADLTGANLERAVFVQCNLIGIRVGRARMGKSVFVKECSLLGANMTGADLTGANLRETNLRGANLNGASIANADFSRADLSDARLNVVRANAVRMVATDLRRADLRLGDFARADLARADLRGANLTGMSVFEANLPRARLDQTTRHGGMFRTRLRYLPVYEPPKEAGA